MKTNDNQEIYIYSSQHNNNNERQLNELREKVRNDPHNFYTYSENYLSLSIDPWTLEQQTKKDRSLSNSVCENFLINFLKSF
jgi:hypothetical protein